MSTRRVREGRSTLVAIYALWWRDVLRFLRSRSRIVGSVLTPLFFVVFLGSGFRAVEIPGVVGVSYLQFLVPGIAGMTMLFTASVSGLAILSDREAGFLKEILVAPVDRKAIVLGRTAGGATVALLQSVLLIGASIPLGFSPRGWWALPAAVPVLALLAVTFIGFGLALASRFGDSQGFSLVVQFAFFPLFFISGAIYPLSNLPTPVQYLGYLNPLTYGVDALRAVLVGTSASAYPLVLDLATLSASAVAMVVLGAALFERIDAV